MKKIIIVAGDKSADLYAGLLCKRLKEKSGDLEIFSFAGQNCARWSTQITNLIEHSVTGFIEVVRNLPKIFQAFNEIVLRINTIKPDLIILLDFPDFNLRLAKKINKKYPVFYYISPQVWAWRKNRINQIKKYVDKIIVLFKFERDFYSREGIDALYFGHPLLEIVKKTDTPTKNIITLMPGSRKNEIKKHLPIMLKAIAIIKKSLPAYSFRLIRLNHIDKSFYRQFGGEIEIIEHSYKAIEESKFVIATSGTTTVELAILEIPFILMYKVNLLSWLIAKALVKLKFAGMVNILAGRKIVDEFLQNDATAQKIARRTIQIVTDNCEYFKIKNDFKKIKETLLPDCATNKLADYITSYLHHTEISKHLS